MIGKRYAESTASRILRDCPPAAQSSLTGGLPEEFEGESLSILWLKLVTSKLLNPVRLGWRVTACLAGSHEIETFSGGKNYLRPGFLITFDFLARIFSAVLSQLPTS
jgi:hypothetical protein